MSLTNQDILKQITKCDNERPFAFISYSSENADVVWRDVLEFQKRGYNVWLDEKNLNKENNSWREEAIKVINDFDCRLVVFYVSRTSLVSGPCLNELRETKSEETLRFHMSKPVKFIAIDVEEGIGSITDYQERIYNEIISSNEDKDEKKVKIAHLASFISEFFNNNNEKIRISPNVPNRKVNYYDDILEVFEKLGIVSDGTKKVDEAVEVEAPAEVPVEIVVETDTNDQNEILDESSNENVTDSSSKKRASVTGDIKYTLYGKEYENNQSDMMLRVFAQVLKRHPDKVAILPELDGMNCAMKKENIVDPGKKTANPSYFRNYMEFTFDNGESVCIGTAYSSGDKMKKIAKLLEHCGEDRDIFYSEQVEIPVLKSKNSNTNKSNSNKAKTTKDKKDFLAD